jgi:hypothetical protein
VPDGVISLAQNTFRYHHPEGLEALLKPVSQVRILPGAQARQQVRACFCGLKIGSCPSRVSVAMKKYPLVAK